MKRSVVAAVLLLAIGCTSGGGSAEFDGSTSRLDDTLETLRGKPVVVNYWATWCKPCKAEMPHIVDAARKYKGDVSFVGVNVEDDVELAAAFAKDYEMPFRSIADPKKEITNAEGLLGLPATQFYDSDGGLAFVKQGEIKKGELNDKIEDLLRASA